MLVREWMTTVPITLGPDSPVGEAEQLMRHRRIRHLPVMDGERLVGIISDRDVRTAMPSATTTFTRGEIHYLLDELRVGRIMTRAVITIAPGARITDAVGLVLTHRIGALPVVEGTRLVGIITETDLLRAFAVTCASCETAPGALTALAERTSCPARPDALHTILVPLDGSPGSESVLPTVGELARARGAGVRLLRVVPAPPAVHAGDRVVSYAEQESQRVEFEMLGYLKGLGAALTGIPVESVVRFGDAAQEIVHEAQSARVNLIAMASHQRRGLDRVLKGSVAETVERAAVVPVVLVPYGVEPS